MFSSQAMGINVDGRNLRTTFNTLKTIAVDGIYVGDLLRNPPSPLEHPCLLAFTWGIYETQWYKILHHVETIENQRLLVFTGESSETRVSPVNSRTTRTTYTVVLFEQPFVLR